MPADPGALLRELLRVDPRLTVSEWADRYRVLGSKGASEVGRWRTSRTPYLRGIMDSLGRPGRTVFTKGAQVGGTEAGNNFVGWAIDEDPAPMLLVMPSEEMAKRNSKTRLQPLISDCERLRNKVAAPGKGNTVFEKDFPGGVLVIVGANAPAALRSMPVKRAMLDEEDAYPEDVGGEGDPADLVEARLRTYPDSSLFRVSTPTMAVTSRIWRAFEDSNQQHYFVPCPHCGHEQHLEWGRMRWDENEDDPTPEYECGGCGEAIKEQSKTWMLARGKWVALNPGHETRGFHLNSLYSPMGWFSWRDALRMWRRALGSENTMKVFRNTVLGLTYTPTTDALDWEELWKRRGDWPNGLVPRGVSTLTAGIDVQADRLEIEIVGWGDGLRSWSVDYRVLKGDTAKPDVWGSLTNLMMHRWMKPDGTLYRLEKAAVDSGWRTQDVYRWAMKHPTLVIPTKGISGQATLLASPTAVEVTEGGSTVTGGLKLWPLGVDVAKMEITGWLRLTDGEPGHCQFPEDRPEEWYRQLTAERMVLRHRNGYEQWVWEKYRDRNEALDCRVMARAALAVMGVDRWGAAEWEGRRLDGTAREATTAGQRGGRVGAFGRRQGGLDA